MRTSFPTRRASVAIVVLASLVSAPQPVVAGGSSRYRTFSDGTWEVGDDIRATTYRTRRASENCYWARLRNFRGGVDSIKANDFTDGPAVVTIRPNDRGFESSNCGTWTTDLSRITSSRTTFAKGTFIVGVDMRPGRYRNSSGRNCYWERLSNFTGTSDAIIANDFLDGTTIVEILDSDEGFSSSGCGTWRRR